MKFSYTSASDFQTCKARFFHKYVAKDCKFESTPALEWGRHVHDSFRDYLNAGKPLPEELHKDYAGFLMALVQQGKDMKLLVEQRLGIRADGTTCGFYDADCFWGGVLDTALFNDTTAILFDWKTGKRREDPFELRVQAVLLYAKYSNLQVFKGRYVWLKTKEVGELHNLSDLHRTWAEMQALGGMVQRSMDTNWFPEQEGPLCAYCPAKTCKFNRSDVSAAAK